MRYTVIDGWELKLSEPRWCPFQYIGNFGKYCAYPAGGRGTCNEDKKFPKYCPLREVEE